MAISTTAGGSCRACNTTRHAHSSGGRALQMYPGVHACGTSLIQGVMHIATEALFPCIVAAYTAILAAEV